VELTVKFPVIFDVPTLESAVRELLAATGATETSYWDMSVKRGRETWAHDDVDEFYSEIAPPHDGSSLRVNVSNGGSQGVLSSLRVERSEDLYTEVQIYNSTRPVISRVMRVFYTAEPEMAQLLIVEPDLAPIRPRIFIGHGGVSQEWSKLKDHLRDHHDYEVVAFQTGARSGHTIRDILQEMLLEGTFALLVMTAEDEQADGSMRARQNVVHEAGLFQGRLGFNRAIILLEDGVENFSNLDGVQYIPFAKGNIRETYGDVLATLHREFS